MLCEEHYKVSEEQDCKYTNRQYNFKIDQADVGADQNTEQNESEEENFWEGWDRALNMPSSFLNWRSSSN